MIKWLLKLLEDMKLARDELDRSWFILPPFSYPIEIYINPEWFKEEKSADKDQEKDQE